MAIVQKIKEEKNKSENNEKLKIKLGMAYAFFVFIIGAIVNYKEPFDANPDISPKPIHIFLWVLLYLPIIFVPIIYHWKLSDVGFSITPISILLTLFFIISCSLMTAEKSVSLYGIFSEALARTGEEFFFRGYIFLLVKIIFNNNRRPWVWAVIISSICFTLVHTQTFQPSYFTSGTESMTVFIVQRLLNVFMVGIVLALIRYFSKSILPCSVAHAVLTGGAFTVPFVIVIYALPALWDFKRNGNRFPDWKL